MRDLCEILDESPEKSSQPQKASDVVFRFGFRELSDRLQLLLPRLNSLG